MPQTDVLDGWDHKNLAALIKKVGGPEAAQSLLASRRILRLVREDDLLRFEKEVTLPAIEETVYAAEFRNQGTANVWGTSGTDLHKLPISKLETPIPASPPMTFLQFGLRENTLHTRLHEVFKPNHVYPESLEVLQYRIFRSLRQRQPFGETEQMGGVFTSDPEKDNCFSFTDSNGKDYILILRWDPSPQYNRAHWMLYARQVPSVYEHQRQYIPAGSKIFVPVVALGR